MGACVPPLPQDGLGRGAPTRLRRGINAGLLITPLLVEGLPISQPINEPGKISPVTRFSPSVEQSRAEQTFAPAGFGQGTASGLPPMSGALERRPHCPPGRPSARSDGAFSPDRYGWGSAPFFDRSGSMAQLLNELYQKKVEVTLIRLHYPYSNSQILAKLLALNALRYKPSRIFRTLFKKAPVGGISMTGTANNKMSPLRWVELVGKSDRVFRTRIAGMKLQLAGRVSARRGASRALAVSRSVGSLQLNSITSQIDYGKFVWKTQNGAFCIKVWTRTAFLNSGPFLPHSAPRGYSTTTSTTTASVFPFAHIRPLYLSSR